MKAYINRVFFGIILLFSPQIYAQIIITEVYYDSAFNECYDKSEKQPNGKIEKVPLISHLGEYIELYNYTQEDISLDGWYITDNAGKYVFPKNTIIKAEGFLLLALDQSRMYPDSKNYFPIFFPNTKGKESQILYQNQLELNNVKETIGLYTTRLLDFDLKRAYLISQVKWRFIPTKKQRLPKSNRINDLSYKSLNGRNFYTSSLQLNDGFDVYSNHFANPLWAEYVPETMSIYDIPFVKEVLEENLVNTDWSKKVRELLDQVCNLPIVKIYQTPKGTYNKGKRCFVYDASGNYTGLGECTTGTQVPPLDISKEIDDPTEISRKLSIEEIMKYVTVYPNPTTGVFTVDLDKKVFGDIVKIEVYSSSGALIQTKKTKEIDYSMSFNISGQPPGLYILKFYLSTSNSFSVQLLKK